MTCPYCGGNDYDTIGYLRACNSDGVVWDPANPARVISNGELDLAMADETGVTPGFSEIGEAQDILNAEYGYGMR